MRETSLKSIYSLAKTDDRIVFIGSDIGSGTLDNFKKEFPDRFFIEGISEQNIVGMAAGLALDGFIPFITTIGTFLTRRCLEQIIVDLCFHNVPVRLLGFGGGVVYAPLGPTHWAVEDFAILRSLPNISIVSPCDAIEMEKVIPATQDCMGPVYIRMGRGEDPIISNVNEKIKIGKAVSFNEGSDALIISTGTMTQRCLDAVTMLSTEGVSVGVLHLHTIKPLDKISILEKIKKVSLIVTVEEHYRSGGLGSAVLEAISDNHDQQLPVIRMGFPDQVLAGYGVQEDLIDKYKLSPLHIANTVSSFFGKKNVSIA